ncbi:beta-phosphoglucomutase [Mangrovimonas sp. AS39]|uniref:beta-phosphoglucomutase n=1 Tax=Mangrovimonas TaxID=1211036 RepID=UPI001421B9F6|nr:MULTISPECIES: beta-phosphoglucomutase [Mangrovimonas]MCF1190931.1 beta-phosphoglucomutase [Mangrovimonas futianensis]MCF1194627.1 beta-phosphoglucomutase [Mangrovimonas futianensis]MCF1420385.1 beta-phosphoglucomutase [Mangrovimonas futianensis]NIK91486.1 beta-phosphoglucomutase [Mangrovimonas sp. CR14]
MHKKGFIFDLDGVIVDTAKYHFLAWKNLANNMGVDFTEIQNEQLKGVSRVKSLEKILNWGNKSVSEEEFMELMAIKNEEYLGYINKMTEEEILPDVPKILSFLQEENQGIALGSASKNARTILNKVKLFSVFETIVDGNDVSKAKPNPEVFLIGAQKLGLDQHDCIVFEDSVAGIKAANNAGMISIGIGDKDILHEADYVFKDFTEISTDFIKELIEK